MVNDTDPFSLIGEHIDYVLFGAFPAAIERDILIACGPSLSSGSGAADPGGVRAQNLNPKYDPQTFTPMLKSSGPSAAEEADAASAVHAEPAWHLDINTRELRWESYIKAGYYVREISTSAFNDIMTSAYRVSLVDSSPLRWLDLTSKITLFLSTYFSLGLFRRVLVFLQGRQYSLIMSFKLLTMNVAPRW